MTRKLQKLDKWNVSHRGYCPWVLYMVSRCFRDTFLAALVLAGPFKNSVAYITFRHVLSYFIQQVSADNFAIGQSHELY